MRIKYLLIYSLLVCSSVLMAQASFGELSKAEWLSDLDFLDKQLRSTIPKFEQRVDQQAYAHQFELIKANINTETAAWQIEALLHLVQDESCSIHPFSPPLNSLVAPIKSYWFSDGLYVCDAANKELIGLKIETINGLSIEDVFQAIRPILNGDNEAYRRYIFPLYAMMPSVLAAQNIGQSDSSIDLSFSNGKSYTLAAKPVQVYQQLKRKLANDQFFETTQTQYKQQNYWSTYLSNSTTLFIQIQKVIDQKDGRSFKDFTAYVQKEIEHGRAQKIVLDLRYGGGGNGFKLKAFTRMLRESEQINQKEHLFILQSRATRGTLVELLSILKLNTKAICIGEATAEGPNTVADAKAITLPNSGINLSIPKIFWPCSWPDDQRIKIEADIAISYNYTMYQTQQDPWLESVLSYQQQALKAQQIPDTLLQALIGKHIINGRSMKIEVIDGRLFLSMRPKLKSFFELHTELYHQAEGLLTSDIKELKLVYQWDDEHRTIEGLSIK